MKPGPTQLRIVEMHGPLTGARSAPGESFWMVRLSAPYFGLGAVDPLRNGTQLDRIHPVRTLLLDSRERPWNKHRWRNAELLSAHLIGGQPPGAYHDLIPSIFQMHLGGMNLELTSDKDGSFRTGALDRDGYPNPARFHHVVGSPILSGSDGWPTGSDSDITLPACRLEQGAIPLIVRQDKILPFVHTTAFNLTQVAVSGGGGPKLVRLILVKDGIEFDASVTLPDPMGTLTGRFLLAPRGDNGGLILRLLVSQLDQNSVAKWLGAWQRLAPNDDAAGALAAFVQSIYIQTSTETINSVAPPELKFSRWLALLPALDSDDRAQAAPALVAKMASEGAPLSVSVFGIDVAKKNAALVEYSEALSLWVNDENDEPSMQFSPLPGSAKQGRATLGLIARIDPEKWASGAVELGVGFLSGRWVESVAKGLVPDPILAEAEGVRTEREDQPGTVSQIWTGALTFYLRVADLSSAICWPRADGAPADPSVPVPNVGPHPVSNPAKTGTGVLSFKTDGPFISHNVTYTLDGHRVAFAKISQLIDESLDDPSHLKFLSFPVAVRHKLALGAGTPFEFDAVEMVAFGRAATLIPPPVSDQNGGGKPPTSDDQNDPRTFSSDPVVFAPRYRDRVLHGREHGHTPGMDAAGYGRISTVLSGTLGEAFREAFWNIINPPVDPAHPPPPPRSKNPLVVTGGFLGLVASQSGAARGFPQDQEHLLSHLVRLPVLVCFTANVSVSQKEAQVTVAWADGVAEQKIAASFRTAVSPASGSYANLCAAMTESAALAGGSATDGFDPALLVEQSFRAETDRPAAGDPNNTNFFPAAALSVSRLIDEAAGADAPPTVISLVAWRVLDTGGEKPQVCTFSASLLTRTLEKPQTPTVKGSVLNSFDPLGKVSLLATLGDAIIVSPWNEPTDQPFPIALVRTRAAAQHAVPRLALAAIVSADTGALTITAVEIPVPRRLLAYCPPVATPMFEEGRRGFGLPMGENSGAWVRGVEEGVTSPFRDADDANPDPIQKSGLAGLSRTVALPLQARRPRARLLSEDLLDLLQLLEKLRSPEANDLASQYLWSQFPADVQKTLTPVDPTALLGQKTALLGALNTLISGKSIYDSALFPQAATAPETKALVGQQLALQGTVLEDTRLLNRLLLQQAYPTLLAPPDVSPIYLSELRTPVYLADPDLDGLPSTPIPWLEPGQTRPRLPTARTLERTVASVFEKDRAVVALQWIVPWGGTVASVADRAGVALVRITRLEAELPPVTAFDYAVDRFGRPGQDSAWSVRTERTPRPGPLPINTIDLTQARRPCASAVRWNTPVEFLRGPADMVTGEILRDGKSFAWAIKFVAAAQWGGMITDSSDGTIPLDVEIDVDAGGLGDEKPRTVLQWLLMPTVGKSADVDKSAQLQITGELAVGALVMPFRRLHFLDDPDPDFQPMPKPQDEKPRYKTARFHLVLDPRLDVIVPDKPGAPSSDLSRALRAGSALPPVEVRLTVYPLAGTTAAPSKTFAGKTVALTVADPLKPILLGGRGRPPATLRLPLSPVMRSRGALPLAGNTLLFIDPSYDATLGSAPAGVRDRIEHPRKNESATSNKPVSQPLPAGRGDLLGCFYADRERVNRQSSVIFMVDLAFEKPLSPRLQAIADNSGADGGDLVNASALEQIILTLGVTPRNGQRRMLYFRTPVPTANPTSTPPPPQLLVNFCVVYELPLGKLTETDGTAAKLAAGDMLELTVTELSTNRVKPILWDANASATVRLDGLDSSGVETPDNDQLFTRTLRILLTDEPVSKNLRLADHWMPVSDASNRLLAGFFRYYLWIHIIAGWILTTLWVGGFTGLIKG